MTIDMRHDTNADVPVSRPGSENQPVPIAPAVSRHPDQRIYEGSVYPAQHAAFHGQHPAYAPLPLHIAALHDYRHLPRQHPQFLEIIAHYHLWPAITTVGYSACGWWANMEPNHVWLMLPFLAGGTLFPVMSWLAHHFHGDNADRHITHGLIVGALVGFAGAASVGAGFSGISAMASVLLAAVGTLGSIGWRRSTKQAAADAAVDWMGASAQAPMPPAPVGAPTLAIGTPVGGGILSDEAARLHAAFSAIGVEPIQVDAIRRLGDDTWMTYIYTPQSKSLDARWLNARTDTLRNNLRCRAFQMTPTALGNRFEVRVTDGEESPLDETQLWPGPNTDDITQPIHIGVDEALHPISIRLKGRHTLYGGITDGGKSIGVNVIACTVASVKNAVMVLMDLKPGQLELGPYERVAYRAAFGVEDAKLLLLALGAAMEERGQILREERERTGKPVKEWDPNNPDHGPAIVVLMDELAELLRLDATLFELWIRLMQVARALGIYIIGATQSPSSKALGGTTDGTGQFTNVVCYRTKTSTQTNVILGQGSHGDGWRCDEVTLPLSGMFRPRTPEYPRPSAGRGYMITPERIMQVIEEREDDRPALDERTAAAMEAVLNGRCDPHNPDGPGGGSDASSAQVRHLHAVEVLRYPDKKEVEEEFRDVWALFQSMGSATVKELMAHRLPTFGSRDRCTTALNNFKNHLGAVSEKDADGRSERFVCTKPSKRSREA